MISFDFSCIGWLISIRRLLCSWLLVFSVFFATLLCSFAVHAGEEILIIRSASADFEKIVAGTDEELDGEVSYSDKVLEQTASEEDMYIEVKNVQPKVLVLVGNRQLRLFRQMKKNRPNEEFPPVIAVAALFIDRVMKGVDNVTGTLYEIPAVTGLVALRQASKKKISKVGMIYLEGMEDMMKMNEALCKAEGIELVGIPIFENKKSFTKLVKKALKKLNHKSIDAIWISNDSNLLSRELVINAWMPFMSRYKKPVVVGVSSLVNTRLNIGSIAVFPDHTGLGVQTAGIIFEVMDNDWQINGRGYDQPISVIKHVNITISKKRKIKYKQEGLRHIDEIIK